MPQTQKRVLIIASYFPPASGIGAVRTGLLVKNLPQFGWTPLVVDGNFGFNPEDPFVDTDFLPETLSSVVESLDSSGWSGRQIAQVVLGREKNNSSHSLWHHASMFVRNKFSPDRSNIKFFHQLLERLPSIIKEYDPQIVFSSSPMTASHAAVSKVVQQAGIPWIAEFRDTFEQVYKSNFLRSLIGKREAKNLEQASAVIGVTPVMVERLKSRYKGEVHLIPNGFSPDQFPSPAPELDQKFSITYTGSMTARLLKHRKPELLFEALDKLFESGCVSPDDCQVNLVGNIDQRLFKRIGHCKSQSTINLAGHVSRLEAASYQIKSQILLQLAHGDEKGILTGKIFEYLGAGRPILSIPKDHDCVDSLLVTTSAGVSCDTVKEVADFIKKSYDQWRTNGVVSYDGKDVEIRKFHRESQAERIASILDRHSSI